MRFKVPFTAVLSLLFAGLFGASLAPAATVTWTGTAANLLWNDPGNWTGGSGVPTGLDDVVFTSAGLAGTPTITLGGDRAVNSVTFNSGTPSFNLDNVGSTNTLTVNNGTIASATTATSINFRTKVFIPGSTATFSNSSSGVVSYANTITFTGTLNYIGTGSFGRHIFLANNSGTLNANIVFNGGNSGELDLNAPSFLGLGTGVGKTLTWTGGTNTTLRPLNGLGTQPLAFNIVLGTENGGNHNIRVENNSSLNITGNISGTGHLSKNASELGRLILSGNNQAWTGNLTVKNAGGGITLATVFNDPNFQRSAIADGKYSLGSGNVEILTNGALVVKQTTELAGTLTINAGTGAFGSGAGIGNGQILVADGMKLFVESLVVNGVVFPNGTYSRTSSFGGINLSDYWPTSTVSGFNLGTGLIQIPEPASLGLLAAGVTLLLLRRR